MYSCKVVNYNGSMSMIDSRTNKPKRSDYLICNLKQKIKKLRVVFLLLAVLSNWAYFIELGEIFQLPLGHTGGSKSCFPVKW